MERTVQAGFAFALVCLTVIAVAAWYGIAQLRDNIGWVQHTREVLGGLEKLHALTTDAQNSRRGFMITGEDSYLEPHRLAVRTAGKQLQELNDLLKDNPAQQQRLDQLGSIVNEQLRTGEQAVELRRSKGFVATLQAAQVGRGKEMHDSIRSIVNEMTSVEEALLQERRQRTEQGTQIVQAIILFGSIIAIGVTGLAMFVTHRGFVRRKLAETERDRFFTLSLDLLCIASGDGYFKRVNPAVQEILGWTPEEFLTRPFLDFVHPDDHEATMKEVEKQIVAGKTVLRFENRYLHKNGSWRILSWASVPHENLMYAMARDMTGARETEAQINRLNFDLQARAIQLETANKELESFSYSVSHDLRAPLRHIHGYVQMLTRESEAQLSDNAKRYLKTIQDAGREMAQLIDDLLSFSRMGRAEMHTKRIDLADIVRAVRQDLDMTTRGRNIEWHIDSLPAVEGDINMLKQVCVNLLDNAVKYSRQRDPAKIEICHSGEQDGMLVFFVRDNGAGFDMRYADKLFGVFQRLHRADEFEGTGIGLANVQRIIARHGGRVWAEGKPDLGATIYFTLKPASA
ncbi:MAG: CHASE3 domain-containing protein [Rhodocyclaceae bacterium]